MGKRVARVTDVELGALFTRAQAGDREAMAATLEAMEPRIRATCRRYEQQMSRDPALAFDDLIQQGRLAAINAVRGWTECGISASAWVTVRLRGHLSKWVKRAGDSNASALSLDEPVGKFGRSVGEVGSDPALRETQEMDLELEDLLDRIPRAIGAGEDHLVDRLRPGPPNKLPNDETLVRLVREGKTVDELAQMFWVVPRTIGKHLTRLRKTGASVPHEKRPKSRPHSALQKMPWNEKLQIIKEYLNGHPGVSNRRVTKDLGTTYPTLNKARAELAQMAP